jgi:hypothetical protein
MRAKVIVFVSLATVLMVCGIAGAVKPIVHEKQEEDLKALKVKLEKKENEGALKLHERAKLAKVRNETQVVIPAVASLQREIAGDEELDNALPNYTLVVAEPTQVKAYIDDESIRSWYKFKIIEKLSEAPPRVTYAKRTVPEQFLPVQEDELLIQREGGAVKLDGVVIRQNEEGVTSFRKNQRYLLFVSLDPSTRVAELSYGGASILPINPDDTLDARREDHILQRLIRNRYEGSLGKLKNRLKK